MPEALPCPNPTCSHVFQPEAVKGAAALSCPRCGSTFALKAGPAAPTVPPPAGRPARPSKPSGTYSAVPPKAPPNVPVATRVPTHMAPPGVPLAVPVAQPVPPPRPPSAPPRPAPPPPPPVLLAVPLDPEPIQAERPRRAEAAPLDELEVDTPRGATISLRRGRSAASSRSPLVPMLVVSVITACVAGAGYYLWKFQQTYAPPDVKGVGTDFRDFNFSVAPPDKPWKQDSDVQDDLKVGLAWTRTGPANHLALAYHDYEQKQPVLSEMLDAVLMKLRPYFENLTWQPRAPATLESMERNATLAGRPAFLFDFEGDRKEVHYVGECVLLDYRGFGYWLVTWAPEAQKDEAAAEWEGLRAAFKVLNEREGWAPKTRETREVRGAGYTLRLPVDLWREQKIDEPVPGLKGLYIGFDYANPRERFIAHKSATLHVHEADTGGVDAALKEARTQLEAQVKEGGFGEPTIEELGVRDLSPGGAEGKAVRLRLRNAGSAFDRFVLLAALPAGDGAVVLQGECAWKRRDLWETELLGVANSFRPR